MVSDNEKTGDELLLEEQLAFVEKLDVILQQSSDELEKKGCPGLSPKDAAEFGMACVSLWLSMVEGMTLEERVEALQICYGSLGVCVEANERVLAKHRAEMN